MNGKTAIAYSLLLGKKITIKTAFKDFGVSNLPREISRQVERPFGVIVCRVRKVGKTRFGVPCTWFEYYLRDDSINREGRIKMKDYIKGQVGNPRTERENKIIKTITLL